MDSLLQMVYTLHPLGYGHFRQIYLYWQHRALPLQIYINPNGRQYSDENPQTFCQTLTLFKICVMVWCLETQNCFHFLHRNGNITASSHRNYECDILLGSWWTRLLVSTRWSHSTLLIFERKIQWKIFGPTRENQLWRIKTNDELDKLIKHQNIINHIKAIRLSWFGHIQRMPDSRTVNKIFTWTPVNTRSKGRPTQRCEDNIIQDILQLNIKNWTVCVQDWTKWKNIVQKAKTFNRRS